VGQVARTDELGQHVSTGKLGPAGVVHAPDWGEWRPEWGGIEMRVCQHDACDVEEYRNIPADQLPEDFTT
jgi:hypothetical protein